MSGREFSDSQYHKEKENSYEGYKMVTPFFIEDGGKAGTYSWEYVNAHLVVRTK